MNQELTLNKIKNAVDSIFAYSLKRTSTQYEAEDLSQDILLNLYTSYKNLKDDRKFYAWMWGVADNVYKTYLRKRKKHRFIEFNEEFHINDETLLIEQLIKEEALGLIFRELSILSGLYRETMMRYYIEDKSCAEIASELNLSENMVKQYLFKSRNKVKEGVKMIRERGERSVNPKKFNVYYWGNAGNYYSKLFKRKLPGNIMLECYYLPVTIEQLSIELGIASVYLEEEVNRLLNYNLLTKKANRYQTNMVIFTKEFEDDLYDKTKHYYIRLADYVNAVLTEKESEIRGVGFTGSECSFNTLKWQCLSLILYQTIIERYLQENIKELPLIHVGYRGYIWGMERVYGDQDFDIGINGYRDDSGNRLVVMDYAITKKKYQDLCKDITGDTLLKIASGCTIESLNRYEHKKLKQLIEDRYVCEEELAVNMPVYKKKEIKALKEILRGASDILYKEFQSLIPVTEQRLKNYVPKGVGELGEIVALKQAESFIVEIMTQCFNQKYIHLNHSCNEILSAYIILNN